MRNKVYPKTLKLFMLATALCSLSQTLNAGWTTPVTISSTVSDQPDIVLDSLGNAVACWQGFDGSNYIIQSATQPKSGSWSTPATLSESGENAQNPQVDVDKNGNAAAIWSRYDGLNSIIQSAQLPFSGSWSSPVNISVSGANADSCVLAMDSSGSIGNAVAVWHRYNGSNFIIQGAMLPSGGSWTPPANISVSGEDALVPQVAVDHSGNALIVCTQYDGSTFEVRSASQLYSQPWGPNFTLSLPAYTVAESTIGVDSKGNGYILWSQFDGLNYIIQAAKLPFGGSWSAPTAVSLSGESAYIPDIVVDSAGNVTAFWVRFDGSNYILQSSQLPLLGSWTTPVDLSTSGQDVGDISVAVDPTGNVIVVWDITDGTNSKIQAATLPINGNWSTPVDVSTSGNFAYLPSVDADSSGNATAIWLETNGTTFVVKGASLPFGS